MSIMYPVIASRGYPGVMPVSGFVLFFVVMPIMYTIIAETKNIMIINQTLNIRVTVAPVVGLSRHSFLLISIIILPFISIFY